MREYPVPAAYLILRKRSDILLLRRFNTGYQDGRYSLIAGHVEPGETFTRCIIREAAEEVGIVVSPDVLRVVHTMHRRSPHPHESERIDVFFTAGEWKGEVLNLEPQKCDHLAWFETDSLPPNTIPFVRHAINAVGRGIHYSEYGWDRHTR